MSDFLCAPSSSTSAHTAVVALYDGYKISIQISKVVRVPVPVLWTQVNDSPVRVIFEDSVLRVPGRLNGLSPASPQGTWGLKGMGPASPQGTWGAKSTESRQSTGSLGADRSESRQSSGYLVSKRTEPRKSTGYLGAERTESRQSTGYLGAKRTESRQSSGYLVPGGRKD